MKNKFLVFLFLLFFVGTVQAFDASQPERKSLSETRDSVYGSSLVITRGSNPNGVQNSILMASATVALKGINVSIPGRNSILRMFDQTTGTAQGFIIDDVQTSSPTYLTYGIETSSGLVYISTCGACLLPWVQPQLRFDLFRVR